MERVVEVVGLAAVGLVGVLFFSLASRMALICSAVRSSCSLSHAWSVSPRMRASLSSVTVPGADWPLLVAPWKSSWRSAALLMLARPAAFSVSYLAVALSRVRRSLSASEKSPLNFAQVCDALLSFPHAGTALQNAVSFTRT